MMRNKDRQTLFEHWAHSYDSSLADQAGFPFIGYSDILAQVVKHATLRPGLRVLEIGVGTGNLTRQLVDHPCAVTGIDFSSAMLSQAREKLPNVELRLLDFGEDTWAAIDQRRFDRIVATYIFHEFPLTKAVSIIKRLADDHLEPGGKIVFGDIAFPTHDIREQAHRHWAEQWDDDEYYWAADEALSAFRALNLLGATYAQISSCAGIFVIDP